MHARCRAGPIWRCRNTFTRIARSPSIFQMNIQQSRRFGEYIQIWPGDRDNEIEVVSTDGSLHQLVLRVKEPPRRYVEVVTKTAFIGPEVVSERARASGGSILLE